MRMFLTFAIVVLAVADAATIEDGAQLEAMDRLNTGDNCWWACGEKGGICDACPKRYSGRDQLPGKCCRQLFANSEDEEVECYNSGCHWYHCCA